MTDSAGISRTGDGDVSQGAGSIPSTSSERVVETTGRKNSSSVAISGDDQVAGPSSSSNQQAPTVSTTSRAATQQQASTVERQNSTSSTRSDGGAGGERERGRFPFLDFDSGAGPRHIQALTMFQEWARNSMGASIPILGSSSSAANTGGDNFNINDRARQSQVQRQPSDTQISIPGGGETMQQPPLPAPMSNPALSLSSRLARGLLQSNFRRRSDEIPEPPVVSYNQATSTAMVGNTSSSRDREGLTLDIESNGGVGAANSSTSWGDNNQSGAGGHNNVPDDDESRRASADGQSGGRRVSPSGSTTPTRGGGTGGGSAEGTPTAPGDILRDSPETRAFIEEINHYTTLRPFLILMLLKSLVDHGSGIVCFFALIVTFSHANSLLKKEISKQRKRNLLFLIMIVVNLIGCAAFIYYVFSDEELYYALGFMSTKVDLTSFWMLMWVVGVTDYIAKFGAIVAKSFIVAMPTALIPFQKRGIYYLFIEQTSQLYRSALPAHHWLLYLVNSYEGSMKMFGLILGGLYALFKLVDSVQRVKDWNTAFRKLFQNVHYGTSVTAKELDSMDSVICPICHDSFTSPTRLSCSHVFCEECVSTWFDRGMTCPMCRAKVVDDPSFRDGTTAQYIQFF
ncbi:RING finger and transmembrane domain-containing protein 2 isoform X2 [Folsomia candida]|uniref:RING finger and transmembrane domain-containing protein 2 n=1 Tax=Folsomia candida TaxID=158441 RepID=A0A226E5J4_FOLCA|nr:RING finger and transmembrane domain-containing protein 2 isoform X2 [Folsomia candida]OXA52568.1 RING finger and transmembrane domain-containing protein 2 [Folsomia candida]